MDHTYLACTTLSAHNIGINCSLYCQGLNKVIMEQKCCELRTLPSPVMSKLGLTNLGWVYYGCSPDRMELNCWVEWQHPNLLWLVWPMLANSWLLWRNYSSSSLHRWENSWIAVPVPVPDPHAKWNLESDFGFQFWKAGPVPVQFWVTQGPELVFDIWLPFS
jgi:hypothetical protein